MEVGTAVGEGCPMSRRREATFMEPAQLGELAALVEIYRALGGGWQP